MVPRYLGGAHSKSGLTIFKFWLQNTLLNQFRLKQHSLFILIWDLKTLLLFLDMQIDLILYFKIAFHSSAAFYKRFWKYEAPIFLFYYGYIYIYIYIYTYIYISRVLEPALSKFTFMPFCSILIIFGVSRFDGHLARAQEISENVTLFLISNQE